MQKCVVTVVAYDSRDAAAKGWEHLTMSSDRSAVAGIVDTALVETDDDTVHTFVGCPRVGIGRGAAVGALLGLVRPVAMRVGAIAGGVGDEMILTMRRSLDRADIAHLGQFLDGEHATIVTLADEGAGPPLRLGGSSSVSVSTRLTRRAVEVALRTDAERDAE